MNISIRGLPSDYTLVLVDGKRLNQNSSGARPNGFGDVDTNFIPPMAAIERIEVVRGPMSTLYGSDAMGGVINIITRKVSQEWMGQITLDGTAQGDNRYGNNYGSAFYLSGPIATDKLGLTVRGGLYRRLSANGSLSGQSGGIQQRQLHRRHRRLQRAGRQPAAQPGPAPGTHAQPQPRHPVRHRQQLAGFRQRQWRAGHAQQQRGQEPAGWRLRARDALQPPALRADASGPLRRLGQLRHQPGVRHHRDYRPDQSHERAASADRRRQARPGIRQLGLRHQVDHAVSSTSATASPWAASGASRSSRTPWSRPR